MTIRPPGSGRVPKKMGQTTDSKLPDGTKAQGARISNNDHYGHNTANKVQRNGEKNTVGCRDMHQHEMEGVCEVYCIITQEGMPLVTYSS